MHTAMRITDGYINQVEGLSGVSQASRAWLLKNEERSASLDRALRGFDQLLFAIPQFSDVGGAYRDVPPWYHVFTEASQELDSAVMLLLMGFYKDSYRSLRSFVELYVFGMPIYVKDNDDMFQGWLRGKVRTPPFATLPDTMCSNSEAVQNLTSTLCWKADAQALYTMLSGYIHTRGAAHTHAALKQGNIASFNEVGLRTGVDALLKSIRNIGMAFAVCFPMSFFPLPLRRKFGFSPPVGGFLDEGEVRSIRDMFAIDTAEKIESICQSDEQAASLANSILSLPDKSDLEIFESLRDSLDTEPLSGMRDRIMEMLKQDDYETAFATVHAAQRATIRSISFLLFNPFLAYTPSEKESDADISS